MRNRTLLFLSIGLTLVIMTIYSCQKSDTFSNRALSKQIQKLQKQVDMLKPGFGDIMLGVQEHHAKLWFAGTNQNWELADFELHEIEENVEKIENLYPNDDRTKDLSTLDPALDSLDLAIQAKRVAKFRKSFSFLTQRCNDCHQKNGYEFNVITIPDRPPVPNQKFKLGN